MAQNRETPTEETVRALETVCLAADRFDVVHRAPEIQNNHVRRRFGLTPAVAGAVAGLAYAVPEHWKARV